MNKSEQINELALAMATAQGELENASKNSENPAFKRGNQTSKYADLAEVLNTVRPVFASHGLSIVQMPSFEAGVASVETILMHKSGQWISNVASAPVGKQDAQGVGSVITYLRRYSVAAFAGIAQEDDDANASIKKIYDEAVITEADFEQLNDLLDQSGSDKEKFCAAFGIKSVKELPLGQLAKATSMLMAKIKKLEADNA